MKMKVHLHPAILQMKYKTDKIILQVNKLFSKTYNLA